MELININNGSIVVAEDLMMRLHTFQVEKTRMELQEKELKEAMLKAMEENGIKSFENDFVKITYTAPGVKKTVDTNALKEQGLYETFTKESTVKASVRLTWK